MNVNVSRGGRVNEKRGGAVRERDISGSDSSAREREMCRKRWRETDTSRADSPQSVSV